MKFKNKIFSLIILSIFITGCKKNQTDLENKPITFTLYSVDQGEPGSFEDPIAKEITKRTGVKLDIIPRAADVNDSIKILIANGNYPDFIYAKGDLSRLIEANAIIPLDDLIEKYGENIKKLYGNEIVKLRYTLRDPSIYSIGTYEIKNQSMEVSGSMQIQHAVLREFGYPNIKTLSDYENLLLAYTKKYPVINGKKTIGLSLLTDSWFWLVSLANPGNYVIGFPDDGQWIIDQDTLTATYKFLYPQMDYFYKWLNKIYHEGLLDPESFTQNEDLWRQKMTSGYVLGTSYPYWGLIDIQNTLKGTDVSERGYAYLPVTVSEEIKDPTLKDYGFSGGWGIAISKDCKDPVRAFKFLDWMCSEEAQILTNWGIEDIDYYYDEKGSRVSLSTSQQDDERGIGRWVYPFPQAGSGYYDSTGNIIAKTNRETIINSYSVAEKETLKAYGAEVWTDLFPSSKELGISRHGQAWQYPLNEKMTEKINEADSYVKDCLIKMIIGPEQDFDKSWKSMQNHLIEIGIEEVQIEMTSLINMKMLLWKN